MILQQEVLAEAIKKVKDAVPKTTTMPVLKSILIRDGWMIATDMAITLMTRLEGEAAEMETMLLPEKATEMILNLPKGDVELSVNDKFLITIKHGRIVNHVQSTDPAEYPTTNPPEGEESEPILFEKVREAISHTIWAVSNEKKSMPMQSLYFDGQGERINFVGLDGHSIAFDTIPCNGSFHLMIPKASAEAIVKADMGDRVTITANDAKCRIKSDNMIIETRLITGQYFAYQKMMETDKSEGVNVVVKRKPLMEATARSILCCDADTKPLILTIDEETMELAITGGTSEYSETLDILNNSGKSLRIGINPKILRSSLKTFFDEDVFLTFLGPKAPIYVEEEGSKLTDLLLPVNISA